MSEARIVRRSLEDRRPGTTDWAAVDAMSEAEVDRNAAEDADNPAWTEEELSAARLVRPGDRSKMPVSIRLDREVLEFFRREGRGYQSRINAVLLGYVRTRQRRQTR